jgi:peptidoglycan/LPS O-acetylase OafA/YrhL
MEPSHISERHRQFAETHIFGSLDGLRALSIVAVVWHHTGAQAFEATLLRQGNLGVTFFFAISGFLITTLLLRETDRKGSVSLQSFYVRRSLRIFPLYFAVLLLYCFAVWFFEADSPAGAKFWDDLIFYATYTSNWFVTGSGERVIFYFAWSLATEEQFYLVWPSIERFLKGPGSVIFSVLLIALSFVADGGGLNGVAWPFVITVLASISYAICMGVLLAHALHHERSFLILNGILGRNASAYVAVVLMLVLLSSGDALGLTGDFLKEVSLVLIVGTCVIREDNPFARVLAWRPLAWIGVVSYGIYLLHMLVANSVKLGFPDIEKSEPILYFMLTLVGAVIVASVSYRYFELRFLVLKQRFQS